jgi:O-antigen/teichoic acid export membrane protein
VKRILVTTVGTQAAIQLIGLVTGVLVARLAGVEGRGELAAIVAWASAMAYLGDLGMPVAYTYTAARAPERVPQLLGNAVAASALQWLAIGAIGSGVIVAAFSAMVGDTLHSALIYLWVYIPLSLITRYIIAIHQGLGWFASFNLVRLSVPASYLILLVLLAALGKVTVGWILAAGIASNVVAAMLAVLFTRAKQPRAHKQLGFDSGLLRQNLRYGLRAHLGSVEPLNALRVDVLILTVLVSAHDLGLYSVAVSAAAALKALSAAFGLVALPEVARASDWSQKKRVAARIFLTALAVVGVTALSIGVWAEPLVTAIYGRPFADATSLVQVMLVAAAASSLYALLRDILRGLGHPLRSSLPEAVSVAIAIPALGLLVPAWGVMGGAWAVAVASVAALVVAALLLKRLDALGTQETRIADLTAGAND